MKWRKKKREEDLERELRAGLELEIQEQIERGLVPEEARYAALRAFGNATLLKEESRGMWNRNWFEDLGQYLKYAVRQLRRNPGYSVTVVITLALSIGANTAIFSIVNALLLREL